jgi:dihydrofolate reductase
MKIIWYPAATLDGYIADTRGRSDWVSAQDNQAFASLARDSGAVIVGRRTFDQYQGQNLVPGAHTYVLTHNPALGSDDPDVTYIVGGALEAMRRLHAAGHAQAVLAGGGDTSGSFAKANLIDEAWISFYPLILGAGTKLLGSHQGSMRLTPRESLAMAGGVNHHRYEVG